MAGVGKHDFSLKTSGNTSGSLGQVIFIPLNYIFRGHNKQSTKSILASKVPIDYGQISEHIASRMRQSRKGGRFKYKDKFIKTYLKGVCAMIRMASGKSPHPPVVIKKMTSRISKSCTIIRTFNESIEVSIFKKHAIITRTLHCSTNVG